MCIVDIQTSPNFGQRPVCGIPKIFSLLALSDGMNTFSPGNCVPFGYRQCQYPDSHSHVHFVRYEYTTDLLYVK
jgi:hypothetical protein